MHVETKKNSLILVLKKNHLETYPDPRGKFNTDLKHCLEEEKFTVRGELYLFSPEVYSGRPVLECALLPMCVAMRARLCSNCELATARDRRSV